MTQHDNNNRAWVSTRKGLFEFAVGTDAKNPWLVNRIGFFGEHCAAWCYRADESWRLALAHHCAKQEIYY